ncbi:MAG: phage holin family protein [Chloroflexota bacterium]|nr:phage holin family protein [Chloroflexota bacterium]
MKIERYLKQFNWRFLLVRIVVNAFALAITALVTPKIYFVDKSFLNWLLMALMLGLLNALLKPVLQLLTLQFIFVTYGLVLVLVNALLLWLLSILFPNRFAVDSLVWLLVGGLVLGLISSFLENLLGLSMPIVPDEPPELRLQVAEQARQVEWLTTPSSETGSDERDIAIEPPLSETPTAEPANAKPSTTADEASSPSTESQEEVIDSMVSETKQPEPMEEEQEDPS